MQTFTESEIIEVLENKGLEVKQNKTKYFETKGIIKSGDSLNSFIKTIEQAFESVEVSGRGKKRVYTVGNEHSEVQKRVDGNATNGRAIAPEEEALMDEFHQAFLFMDMKGEEGTVSTWAAKLGLEKMVETEEMEEKICRKYNLDTQNWFSAKTIVSRFVSDYNSKMNRTINQTFNRLKKENRIDYVEKYYGVKDEKHIETSYKSYSDFYKMHTKLIKEEGYNYKHYMQLSSDLTQSEYKNERLSQTLQKFKVTKQKIDGIMLEKFGVNYVYRTIKLLEVNELESYNKANYYNQVQLTFDFHYLDSTYIYKYKNYKEYYAESTWFWRSFFYLSATILLDRVDQDVMDNFESDLVSFVERYTKAEASGFGSGKAEIKEGIEQDLNDREAKIVEEAKEKDEEIRKAWELYELEMENELGLDVAIQAHSEEEKYLI